MGSEQVKAETLTVAFESEGRTVTLELPWRAMQQLGQTMLKVVHENFVREPDASDILAEMPFLSAWMPLYAVTPDPRGRVVLGFRVHGMRPIVFQLEVPRARGLASALNEIADWVSGGHGPEPG